MILILMMVIVSMDLWGEEEEEGNDDDAEEEYDFRLYACLKLSALLLLNEKSNSMSLKKSCGKILCKDISNIVVRCTSDATLTSSMILPCTYSVSLELADPDDRHSTSGYCVMITGSLIAWWSRNSYLLTRSSFEAELVALYGATAELAWIRNFLLNIGVEPGTIPAYVDNEAIIQNTTSQWICHHEANSAHQY